MSSNGNISIVSKVSKVKATLGFVYVLKLLPGNVSSNFSKKAFNSLHQCPRPGSCDCIKTMYQKSMLSKRLEQLVTSGSERKKWNQKKKDGSQ